jgi:hypothetical protein
MIGIGNRIKPATFPKARTCPDRHEQNEMWWTPQNSSRPQSGTAAGFYIDDKNACTESCKRMRFLTSETPKGSESSQHSMSLL